MSKKAFDKIAAGLTEALEIARGNAKPTKLHVPAEIDVRGIRKGLGLSQDEFAQEFGFTIHQIRDWEQGRTRPLDGLRAYLMIIERDIHAQKNRLKEAMNGALIAIGSRNSTLEAQALAAAARIGKVTVDHGETDCKTPDAAAYNDDFGQLLLPYDAVRTAPDPDAALLAFLQSTYESAAEHAKWDRAALERGAGELAQLEDEVGRQR